MSDTNQTNYPNWTDDQWAKLRKIVSDEAQKARVAAQFLPLYGPVDASIVAVPSLSLSFKAESPETTRISVDSAPRVFLTTISVLVPLATHEVAETELLAAAGAFRRAAVTVARIEDALIFNGQPERDVAPLPTKDGWLKSVPKIYKVTGGEKSEGLVPAQAAPDAGLDVTSVGARQSVSFTAAVPKGDASLETLQKWGDVLVKSVSTAVGELEGKGHSGPFACYMSPIAFEAVHTPAGSLVLPRDRILPFLGGDYLRRSNTIPNGYGVVIALGGDPIEIVVASDISLQYLQRTTEPKYLFRVSEKIALRVKEWDAVAIIHPSVAPSAPARQGGETPPSDDGKKGVASAKTDGGAVQGGQTPASDDAKKGVASASRTNS
jgi:uncharacterized linocin/CFP29 family protein